MSAEQPSPGESAVPAKRDLRKACTWVHNAEQLTKRHLDPYYYPLISDAFSYLVIELDKLATEGLPAPQTKSD